MSTASNKTNVPEAKEAMNRFKMEVAGELGVPLTEGARRILLKLPRTRFAQYALLDGCAEWPEAAKLLRAFLRYHIDAPVKKYPDFES